MKNIGLITLNGYSNYGNRLQNYALQEVLTYMGFNVETIKVKTVTNKTQKMPLIKRISNMKGKTLEELTHKVLLKFWHYTNKKEISKSFFIRTEIFKKFTSDYIKETDYYISDDNIPEGLSAKYSYFITGSDQVWNPNYIGDSSIYFLAFAEKHKRIAFAPSFGVSEIEPEYVEKFKKWLSGMYRLSVREDDGSKIIKDLTGKDAPVLVDPTLLLTKEKWLSIAKEAANKPKGKYLLTYFLGEVSNDYKKQIENIVKKNGLEVINLGDIREKETYETGPSEFIDYINSCSIFCTDSFHGVVFSILFEKPFIVYERIGTSLSMFSRINTLLDKFNLNSRKAENIRANEQVFNVDYSHIPPILEMERNKALNYLKEALSTDDRHEN